MSNQKNSKEKQIKNSTDLTTSEWLTVVFGFLLLLTPLLSTNLAVFSGIMDQNYWVMFIIFVFAIVALLRQFFVSNKSVSFKFTWLDILMIGWIMWLGITTITSYSPVDSIFGVLPRTGSLLHWMALVMFYFLIRTLIQKSSKVWEYSLIGIIASGSAVAAMSLIKLALGTQQGSELIGMLGNQNFTTYFLAITAITTFVYWIKTKRGVIDYTVLALALQLVAIWFANARWVYVSLFVVFLTVHIVIAKIKRIASVKHKLLIALWMLVIVLGAGNFMLGGKTSFNLSNYSLQHRLTSWDIGLESALQKPLFGWGLENYDNAWQQNFRPEFETATGKTETFDRPHNLVILYLSTTGFVGLGLILALLGYGMLLAWRNRSNYLALWGGAVVMMYVVLNLFGFEMITSTIMLMMALAYLATHAPPLKLQPPYWINHISLGVAGMLTIWLAYLIVMPWVGYQIGWRALQNNDFSRFDAVLYTAPYLKPNLASAFLGLNQGEISPASAKEFAIYLQKNAYHRKNEPGYYMAIAQAWRLSDDPNKYTKMKPLIEKAIYLHNDNNGYYWTFMADLELILGNEEAALVAMERAMELNPNSFWTAEYKERLFPTAIEEDALEETT